MAHPQECRAKGVLRLVLVFAGVCFVGFRLYPPLFGVGQSDEKTNAAQVSCPPCSCECPNDDVFIPLEVLNISNTVAECGKNDAEMNEEMQKDNLDLLSEELRLQKIVANDTLEQTKALITSVRKASSHYQREAEKCSAGMEICEAARARAEKELIEERKLSELWERRALDLGWKDSRSKPSSLELLLSYDLRLPASEGPPKESYVIDDAGVLSRVTRSDLKRLLSDLEARKNFHINFITVRKLTSKADAFEYADQVLEKWYPTVEEGNNKGIVVLVTSQKEGAVSGGPAFVQAVGENILDATVTENLPVLATDEKYNEAVYSSAKRLVAAIDGLPDPGGPRFKDDKRESNYKTTEETDEKRGQFSLLVGGLLVIAFVVPMAQYYAYVSRK